MSRKEIVITALAAAVGFIVWSGCDSGRTQSTPPLLQSAAVTAIDVLSQKDGQTGIVAKGQHGPWCDTLNSISEVRRIRGDLMLKPHYVVKVKSGSDLLVFGCSDDGTVVYKRPGATRWELQGRSPKLLEMIRSLMASPGASSTSSGR